MNGKKEQLLETLKKRVVFFDGGTGSLLQDAGLLPGELPETWNIKHPEVIVKLHRDYLEAGCDIIKTNTFGANRLKYNGHAEYGLREIVTAALRNAKEAVRQAGKGFIALDIGPTGKLLKPMGELEFEDTVNLYKEVVEIGESAGADLILIETMSDTYELKAAVLAAKEQSKLPVFATAIFDKERKLLTGATPKVVIALLEGLGVDAAGINCGLGPEQMTEIARECLEYASIPLIVNPNAGIPRSEAGRTVYDVSAEEFAKSMEAIVALGASCVGGCCGVTPEHISRMTELCRNKQKVNIIQKEHTIATSFARALEIGGDPVIVGERLNPTGKPQLQQALREGNLEYLLQEGLAQQESGALALDVNVGLPDIDEPSMMAAAVKGLQSVTELPLQIDTSDIRAMEQAVRIYNGKALLNSVSGKDEDMRRVFPLVRHYGGVVIALTLDEKGIPDSADGRVAIARKIYETAAEYGIHKKDILIDALCMTVSSDKNGALTTLETVRRIREELGGRTILGVSNISFGLPRREYINAAFFEMAMMSGLNAAIMNPNSSEMMAAYHSFRALTALDGQCADYIRAYGEPSVGGDCTESVRVENKRDEPGRMLVESVKKGLKERARAAAAALLLTEKPLEVIARFMIPALDAVGKGFERGTVYLPQLLVSAEAAKAAFEVINDAIKLSETVQETKGKVILATVKGDIHDIGKNIVKVLLENYGFEVLDLGKDVDAELIVEEAIVNRVPLVGLSALMTTTVPNMQEVIGLLHERAPWVKVMVGGAVLTPEYAKMIGADAYCQDAMASVSFAQKVMENKNEQPVVK